MRNELLDDEFSNSEGKSTAPSWKNWLITSLLWIGLLFNLIGGIDAYSGIAFALLLGVTLLQIWKYRIGVKWMLLPIVFGILGVLSYFHFRIRTLGIDVWMLLLGILHLYTNKAFFPSIFHKYAENDKQEQEGFSAQQIAQIEKFKLLYAEKSLPELEKIASSEKFVAEAKEAARLLLAKNS